MGHCEDPSYSSRAAPLTDLNQWLFLFQNARDRIRLSPQVSNPAERDSYKTKPKSQWTQSDRWVYFQEKITKQDRASALLVAEERGFLRGLEERYSQLAHKLSYKGKTVPQIATLLEKDEEWVREVLAQDHDPEKR